MKTYVKWAISLLSVAWMASFICFFPPPSSPPRPRLPSGPALSEHLIDLENAFLSDLQKGDVLSVSRAVSDDCQIIGIDGRSYDKAKLLNQLSKQGARLYTGAGFQVKKLSGNVGIVSYDLYINTASSPGEAAQHFSVKSHWKKIGSAASERYDWK